jgi:ADP-ribose pyrophosphatase
MTLFGRRGKMNQDSKLDEKIINREAIYQGVYMTVEKLHVQLPNQQLCDREIVRVKDAVAILPVEDNRRVHLVRQYRPAIDRFILEVPAGLVDQDENPEETAIRECEEEIGYKPRKIKKLLTYAHAEGYSTGFITLFLGTELVHTGKIHLDHSEFLEPVIIPFSELIQKVAENQIVDSKTILCTLLSQNQL